QSLVDRWVHGWSLIFGERSLPAFIGAGGGVFGAGRFPFLERVVVGDFRIPESCLVVREGMGAAEEVVARTHLAEGIERQLVVINFDAVEVGMKRAAEIGVHDELLVGH